MMKTTGPWQTAALAGVLLLAHPAAGAGEIGGGPALQGDAPLPVVLHYRELSNSIATWSLAFDPQTQPFVREPAGISGTVHRGLIKLPGGPAQAIAFLWHPSDSRLYLDLNRNRDLTDDTNGVFAAASGQSSGFFQSFANVTFFYTNGLGEQRAMVDLNCYRYRDLPHFNAGCRSFWEGKVLLGGTEWQVGRVDDLSARSSAPPEPYLVLRPWSERGRAFYVQDGSLDAFAAGRRLYLDGAGWRLDWTRETTGAEPALRLTLTPEKFETGELKLAGQYIGRLVLSGGKAGCTVVLNEPGVSVRVPQGSYYGAQVCLRRGDRRAARETDRYNGGRPGQPKLVIATNQPATLVAGGPLTNTVAVTRRGNNLSLDYRLVGAGGEAYTLLGLREAPAFAAFKGDAQVASGQFEFG
mgnify:CR=1 FL=1